MGIDDLLLARTPYLLLCASIVLASCEDLISDSVWIQQRTVAINRADFQKCVAAAIDQVPGVSIDRAQSTDFDISLKVTLTREIPFLGVEVQRRTNGTAEIIFAAKGTHESDEERAAITPVLESIAAAISSECAR
jgi:hypothetical protein